METSPSQPELYLIAHKVRGAPAFDIAHRLMIGDEEGWVVPTSGHRAYPYWSIELNELRFYEGSTGYTDDGFRLLEPPSMPDPWPDHYQTTAAPKGQGKHSADSLVAALGLRRAPTITRRI